MSSFSLSGPCGGKTEALLWLRHQLKAMGFVVFSVPETSTTLRTHGAVYPGREPDRHEITLAYEVELLKMQLHVEESITNVAKLEAPILGQPESPIIILLDRAAMDVKAYATSESTWHEILHRCNVTEEDLLNRYDLICHLTSTAHGAEAYYTTANNLARSEGVKDARELDIRTRDNWCVHPHHYVINNLAGKSFEDKRNYLLNVILGHLKTKFPTYAIKPV
ncbi:hypothetical protein EON65_51315 [archaeon]|nr:MAG: hypothetical protein EON65_51315 [archaeon]